MCDCGTDFTEAEIVVRRPLATNPVFEKQQLAAA
jgi:hypothetical protein